MNTFVFNAEKEDTAIVTLTRIDTVEIDISKINLDIKYAIEEAVATYFGRHTDIEFYDLPEETQTALIKNFVKYLTY